MTRSLRPGEQPPEGVQPRRYKNANGYVRLRWRVGPNEQLECYEHRWVTGCLDPAMHVHHINGVKDDNRPENLQVISPSAHSAHHGDSGVDWAEAERLYRSGLSTPQVGAALGIDAATVYRGLSRHGVQMRSIGDALRLDLDDALIRRLHAAGVRSRRIAKALGVSSAAIDERVRQMGLPPHRPGRPTSAELAVADELLREVTA